MLVSIRAVILFVLLFFFQNDQNVLYAKLSSRINQNVTIQKEESQQREHDLDHLKLPHRPKFFFLFGYQRNGPYSYKKQYRIGIPHPKVGFRYFLDDHWMAGLIGDFKFIVDLESRSEVVLASISQEASYQYRVSHPVYLILGEQIMYISPVKKAMLPMQRLPKYTIDIGVGLIFGIIWKFENSSFLEISIRRWRGTKTMKLHSLESFLGYSVSL